MFVDERNIGFLRLMLHCCGQRFNYDRIIIPLDNREYTNRSLEIATCPRCGAVVCELVQFSKRRNVFVSVRPKKKDVYNFIRSLEQEPYRELHNKVQYGTKSNMNFYYFDTSEIRNNDNVVMLRHVKKDFNNVIRMIIEVPVNYNDGIYYSQDKIVRQPERTIV